MTVSARAILAVCCLVLLAAAFIYRSDSTSGVAATPTGDRSTGASARAVLQRLRIPAESSNAVFIDIEDRFLDHERIETFLAGRPVAAYRIVGVDSGLLRSYIQDNAKDNRAFGLLLLSTAPIEFGARKSGWLDLGVGWGSIETDWNIDIWNGEIPGAKGNHGSLIVEPDDSVTAVLRLSDSQILIEPLGRKGHHVIWRSKHTWESPTAAVGAVRTLRRVVETNYVGESSSKRALVVEAITGLALINTAASIQAAEELLVGNLEDEMKRAMLVTVYYVGTEQAANLIRRTAANPAQSTRMRVMALGMTSSFKDEQDANLYRSLLYHEDSSIRAFSAMFLSSTHAAEAQPHLTKAVADETLEEHTWHRALIQLEKTTGNTFVSVDRKGQSMTPELRRQATESVARWAATQ